MPDLEKIFAEKERLGKKITSLKRTLERREQEYKEIETAICVIEKHLGITLESIGEEKEDITIMDMVLEILQEYGIDDGLPSNLILEEIHKKYNKDIERTSMSPQLSRLRDRGRLDYFDGKWSLKKLENDQDQ
tara:strand:+ start:390595 stop:390993 length:399 start_codon:yes stop_codon:yes gene_type:complete